MMIKMNKIISNFNATMRISSKINVKTNKRQVIHNLGNVTIKLTKKKKKETNT